MKKLVSLSLCLSLSLFAVAGAMKPVQTLGAVAKTTQNKSTREKTDAKTLVDDTNKTLAEMIKAARADNESFDMSEAEEQEAGGEEDTDKEIASDDDDSMENATDDADEGMSGDDASDDEPGGDEDGGDDGGD